MNAAFGLRLAGFLVVFFVAMPLFHLRSEGMQQQITEFSQVEELI
jgi:hypothetical protein